MPSKQPEKKREKMRLEIGPSCYPCQPTFCIFHQRMKKKNKRKQGEETRIQIKQRENNIR